MKNKKYSKKIAKSHKDHHKQNQISTESFNNIMENYMFTDNKINKETKTAISKHKEVNINESNLNNMDIRVGIADLEILRETNKHLFLKEEDVKKNKKLNTNNKYIFNNNQAILNSANNLNPKRVEIFNKPQGKLLSNEGKKALDSDGSKSKIDKLDLEIKI